jgi:hypothetical protein
MLYGQQEVSIFILNEMKSFQNFNLSQFILKYDTLGCIILFSGKRKVLEKDKQMIFDFGQKICSKTKHIIFRTGNADGADLYFGMGVASIDPSRLQTILPYKGHRKKQNQSNYQISLDEIDLLNEPELIYYSKKNKKTEKIIDKYLNGEENKYVIKAAYIIRDTLMVLGNKNVKATSFAFFYDDLLQPRLGGTGHTINICEQNSIPHCNQLIWQEWI